MGGVCGVEGGVDVRAEFELTRADGRKGRAKGVDGVEGG